MQKQNFISWINLDSDLTPKIFFNKPDSDSENFRFSDSDSDSDSNGVGVRIGFRSPMQVSTDKQSNKQFMFTGLFSTRKRIHKRKVYFLCLYKDSSGDK